jgi:hypothetical protein
MPDSGRVRLLAFSQNKCIEFVFLVGVHVMAGTINYLNEDLFI